MQSEFFVEAEESPQIDVAFAEEIGAHFLDNRSLFIDIKKTHTKHSRNLCFDFENRTIPKRLFEMY